MRVRRYICPYDDEDRILMETAIREIYVPSVILSCDKILEDIKEDTLVSRGSLLGYKEDVPVYASIDGRIGSILRRKERCNLEVFDIKVERYRHGHMLWAEIPFLQTADGDFFLKQLGLTGECIKTAETIYISGVGKEPYQMADYRLLIEETEKAVLGADVLRRCMNAERIVFCIEESWHTADYLLNKYIRKYKAVFSQNTVFDVWCVKRRYPMEAEFNACRPRFDIQMAVHAYQGFYEHEPALNMYVSVVMPEKYRNIVKLPVGALVRDVLAALGLKKEQLLESRIILGGLMSGRAASADEAIKFPVRQICVLNESMVPEMTRDVTKCIGCNLCEQVCPVFVSPYMLNKETLQKCIHCNLCSYICPAGISLEERIRRTDSVKTEKSRHKNKPQKRDKKQRQLKSQYIPLPKGTDLTEAVLKSDAPPHRHSANNCQLAYGIWICALALPVLVRMAAEGMGTAGQIVFAAFFMMAFHEILSGFLPGLFPKSHLLEGVADGISLGLILPQFVPLSALLASCFLGTLAEKILWRRHFWLNTPAAAGAVILWMYGGEPGLFFVQPWEMGAVATASLIAALLLRLLGYIYILPMLVYGISLLVFLKISTAEALVLALFLGQRWFRGGLSYKNRLKASVLLAAACVVCGYFASGLKAGAALIAIVHGIITCILKGHHL